MSVGESRVRSPSRHRGRSLPAAAAVLLLVAVESVAAAPCDFADLTKAYRDVLCRAPDAAGKAHYLEQCRVNPGIHKGTIVAEIRDSDEYRACPYLDAQG